MDTGLDGKVVFVTGASGGIGRALLRAFATEGAHVVAQGHRRFSELEAFVADEGLVERTTCVEADVRSPRDMDRALSRAAERTGRVDVCIANAGVWPPEDRTLDQLEPERVREVVDVNLLGATWTLRAWMGRLRASGPRPDGAGAAAVLIGSTAGRFGERFHADYALAKSGLVGLMQTLKNELPLLDPYARCNLVEPGWTATEMARPALADPDNIRRATRTMALRQLAGADDIARAVVTLASPELSRHTTGQVLTVAGGMEGRLLWEEADIDPGRARARADRRSPS